VTTKGWIASGLAGIAAFLAASLLAVNWTERRAPGPPEAPARSVPAPAAPAPTSSRPPEPAPTSERPVPPVSGPGTALPSSMAERARALEPLRQEVMAGLAALDPRIESCQLRDADLLLTLETVSGAVKVLQVQVEAAGAATAEATGIPPAPLDELAVRCVRRLLEQSAFQAPSAVAGRRWELAYRPGSRP
jgi:hypothetical protein